MSMTKKHFEMIAEALRTTGASVSTAVELANRFKQENARFDILRFMEAACGSCWGFETPNGTWELRGGMMGPEYLTFVTSGTLKGGE